MVTLRTLPMRVLAVATIATFAGCNGILGIGDLPGVEMDGGASGSGSASGAASSGNGSASGNVGSGTTGASGTAGSAGSSAADGSTSGTASTGTSTSGAGTSGSDTSETGTSGTGTSGTGTSGTGTSGTSSTGRPSSGTGTSGAGTSGTGTSGTGTSGTGTSGTGTSGTGTSGTGTSGTGVSSGSSPDAGSDATTCVATGQACSTDAVCCNFQQGNGYCVNRGGGAQCDDSCVLDSDCATGCCVTTEVPAAHSSTKGHLVCAPASACLGLGTGDECTTASQCGGSPCTTSVGGWCNFSCATSSDCTGDFGPNYNLNEYWQLNWCVLNARGVDECFPGCATSADCKYYPGTTCKSFRTVEGTFQNMCSI